MLDFNSIFKVLVFLLGIVLVLDLIVPSKKTNKEQQEKANS